MPCATASGSEKAAPKSCPDRFNGKADGKQKQCKSDGSSLYLIAIAAAPVLGVAGIASLCYYFLGKGKKKKKYEEKKRRPIE